MVQECSIPDKTREAAATPCLGRLPPDVLEQAHLPEKLDLAEINVSCNFG